MRSQPGLCRRSRASGGRDVLVHQRRPAQYFTVAEALHSCVKAIGISAGPPADATRLDTNARQNVYYPRRYRRRTMTAPKTRWDLQSGIRPSWMLATERRPA